MLRELVLDTETTGLDPKDNHRIIELACVELINYIPTGTSWHWYFNPERDVPKAATEVHGLTATFLADKPLFGASVHEIIEVLDGARLIIHNAAFDVGFLNHEFARLGHPPISFDRVVDTLALARRKHPGSPNNLDALCRRYGINNSTRTKHGALLDSELLADVYLRLIGAEQAGLDFAARPANTSVEADAAVQIRMKPLPSRLTAEEEAAHAAFVASLGSSAIWSRYRGKKLEPEKSAA
jgi:DNA polymerase III subunit epsilon